MHHHDRSGHIEIGQIGDGRDFEVEVFIFRHVDECLLPIRELHLDRHGLSITADAENHHPSRGHFVNHPAQLRAALDGSAVHGQDDIVLLDSRFARWCILVHHGDFDALLFLKLQSSEPVGGDVANVDAEIGAGARFFAGKSIRLRRRINCPALRGMRKAEQQWQHCDGRQNGFAHGQPRR